MAFVDRNPPGSMVVVVSLVTIGFDADRVVSAGSGNPTACSDLVNERESLSPLFVSPLFVKQPVSLSSTVRRWANRGPDRQPQCTPFVARLPEIRGNRSELKRVVCLGWKWAERRSPSSYREPSEVEILG